MNRDDLLDNLVASRDRRELVTLTLRRVTGSRVDEVWSGRIIALGRHYTSRRSLQVVFERDHPSGRCTVEVIGLTMVKGFQVGLRPRTAGKSPRND